MKKIFCIFLFVFLVLVAFAQKDRSFIVQLPDSLPIQRTIPFSSAIIMDARYDTTKIGFIESGRHSGLKNEAFEIAPAIRDGTKWVETSGSLQKLLQEHLNFYCDKLSVNTSFLVLINELRFRDFTLSGKHHFSLKIDLLGLSGINNLYQPIKRIDTTVTGVIDILSKKRKGIGIFIVDELLQALTNLATSKVDSMVKKYSFQDIESSVKRRFEKEILAKRDKRIGLYLSFEEFLNNAPSQTYDSSQKARFSVFKGEKQFRVWGYCDGSDYYFQMNGVFAKLIRHGNGFCVRAVVDFEGTVFDEQRVKKMLRQKIIPKFRGTNERKTFYWQLFDIDMKTGNYIDEAKQFHPGG